MQEESKVCYLHPEVRTLILTTWFQRFGPHGANWFEVARKAAFGKDLKGREAYTSATAVSSSGASAEIRGMPCLTAKQRHAIEMAMQRRCTLIRGPPGTGKTYTACNIAQAWLAALRGEKDPKILVVTQSNVAAINALKTMEAIGVKRCVRLGAALKGQELLEQRFFTIYFEKEQLDAVLPDQELPPSCGWMLKKVAKEALVIVMTCISSGNWYGSFLKGIRFNKVLIDEAAQCTEPTALVPLSWGVDGFCMIGDDRQLSAIVTSFFARNGGLPFSMFSRLLQCKVFTPSPSSNRIGRNVHREAWSTSEGNRWEMECGFVQLDVQRRMHPSISELPARLFYDNTLVDENSDTDRPPILGVNFPNKSCRVVFVDCGRAQLTWKYKHLVHDWHQSLEKGLESQKRDEVDGASISNPMEAKIVAEAVRRILNNTDVVDPTQVAVITGYSAQKHLLREELRKLPDKDSRRSEWVAVDTIDSFQGISCDVLCYIPG